VDLPPSSHVIYIPLMLIVGAILGFILGTRAAKDAHNLQRRRDEEREAARAARAARKASGRTGPPT
jgi:hypothetical protein